MRRQSLIPLPAEEGNACASRKFETIFCIIMSILVSFLWHMHQPFYKDIVGGAYVMPWAYLHGTKDYLGMATLLEEFPDIHQTFNLVPSLLLQLEEYAQGDARDPSMDLAFKPVERLSIEDRGRIIERFFPVPI